MQKKLDLPWRNDKGVVYVQGPEYQAMTESIFLKKGYTITKDMTKADIIVLTGGEDINPIWYGEHALNRTFFNEARDTVDIRAIQYGVANNKFMVGICRGGQFLNCYPNGGSLWQDVDGHHSHHEIYDADTKAVWKLNSVHHQMMRLSPKSDGRVVAWASVSKIKQAFNDHWQGDPEIDPEVIWYPKTKSLCFQAHPEFGHPPTNAYFFSLMDRFYHKKNDVTVNPKDYEKYDATISFEDLEDDAFGVPPC